MQRTKGIIKGMFSVLLLGATTGCFSTAPAGARPDVDSPQGSTSRCILEEDADLLADQVLQLVNLERAAAEEELAPVVISPALSKIASDYACRMIVQGFFGHSDPMTGHGPGERAVAGKYSYYAVGENLAAGATTAAEVMQLWMDSPLHRAIILDPKWSEVGIAVRAGSDDSVYWVQEFGDPASY
jgi:uncharacterized protein YkwD